MAEHLRTDYDRMVGESYRDYAARCRGRMLATEKDRDALAAEVCELRARVDAFEAVARQLLAAHDPGYVSLMQEDADELRRLLGEVS